MLIIFDNGLGVLDVLCDDIFKFFFCVEKFRIVIKMWGEGEVVVYL